MVFMMYIKDKTNKQPTTAKKRKKKMAEAVFRVPVNIYSLALDSRELDHF